MGKYSERLIGANIATKQGKYSKLILGDTDSDKNYISNPYKKATSEISTITGKPIEEPSENTYKPADFKTLMQAAFVDNNEKKIELFAKSRGISPDRYQIKDGQIWFKSDNGDMYPESPKEVSNMIKKIISEFPADSLSDIGSGVGAVFGGPVGAAGGAALGEAARKGIGRLLGDNQDMLDYAKDMGVQALFGAIDASVGKKIAGKLSERKIKKATGGKISDNFTSAIGEITPEQKAAGTMVKDKADSIGIDLLPHQAIDDPGLTNYYKLLRDNPKTSRVVKGIDDKLDKQVEQAGQDLLKDISTKNTDPYSVGEQLSKAGTEAIEKMKKARGDAVKGLYAKADTVVNVDVTPALEEIARLKQTVKPGMKAHSALSRIERMLVVKKDKTITPEARLKVLDNVKQEIDAILMGKDSSTITNKLKRKMMEVKDILTTQTDKVSRDYQVARALYTAASPKISDTEKGIVGVLSRMKTDEIKEKAIQKIFASRQSIKQAKKHIMKNDPELWQDAVAEYFRDGIEKASKVAQGSGGKVLNRPGKYVSKMWDISNQKKLKIATDGMLDSNGNPLYDRISDFFEVMQKASIGHGKESATWARGKMSKDLEGISGKLSASVTFFKQTLANVFLKAKQQKAFDKNAKKLLELMQTPDGVDLIAKAKGYGPETIQGIQAITTLLLMSAQTNAPKIIDVMNNAEK